MPSTNYGTIYPQINPVSLSLMLSISNHVVPLVNEIVLISSGDYDGTTSYNALIEYKIVLFVRFPTK